MQERLEREVEVAPREQAKALVGVQAVQNPAVFRPRDLREASARGDQVLGKLHPHRHRHCFSPTKTNKKSNKEVQRETLHTRWR